jgi:LacI family transcriptional regulator
MASIRDVARVAQVSTATVSNVLNGRSEKVSAETRERVLAAVRSLRYRPTPLEDKQKAILSQNLGVMVPDLTVPLGSHEYFRKVLDGVMETAALRGWSTTIFVQRMWYDVGQAVRRSYDGRCDGLVMVAPQPGNEVVQHLHERGTLVVLVGTTPWLSGVSSVDIDNEAIGVAAARHLVSLRHKRLAYVGHQLEQVSSIERRESFFNEAKRLGIPEDRFQWIRPGHDERGSDAERVVRELLSLADRPTGLFCWHDGLALPLLAELRLASCRVPEEVSVISVDDSPEDESSNPTLTSFRNPVSELGRRAAQMIIDRLVEGRDATEIVRYPSELRIRMSTGPAPAR